MIEPFLLVADIQAEHKQFSESTSTFQIFNFVIPGQIQMNTTSRSQIPLPINRRANQICESNYTKAKTLQVLDKIA